MRYFLSVCVGIFGLSGSLFSHVEESVLTAMDGVYRQDFGKKVNAAQRDLMDYAVQNQEHKLRVMTYNMLYNVQDAEEKLPFKHRWESRKPRLLEYLSFAQADIIGSQELQEDQVEELLAVLGSSYGCYGEKTRQNEGRSDINALFFNKDRIELIEAQTIPYADTHGQNAFTYCCFRDKVQNKKFITINTKLTWGDVERRLAEAHQLSSFVSQFGPEESIILLGDFNTFPFTQHAHNLFFDGGYVEQILAGKKLQEAKLKSIFGHFGPLCSITNAPDTLEPFIGPRLSGFILDHIFVSGGVAVFTHGIDTARVEGEFPSDHFPVIADLYFK